MTLGARLSARYARLSRRARPRLLNVTIAVMGVVFVMKLMAVLHGADAPSVMATATQVMVPSARAAAHDEPAGRPAAKPAAAPPAAAAPPPPPAEPPISEAERALLMDLRARRTSLDERAGTLDQREAVLAAAERRLSDRLDQLGALQTKLEQLDQTRRERDDANWRGLVKTYEAMRPRDAATIFNELDEPVLMQVLDRMKEAKAGAVLAAMQPERARLATTELAKWRARTTETAQP